MKTPNDQRSDTLNPNNPAYIAAAKNRLKQLASQDRPHVRRAVTLQPPKRRR